MPTKSFSSLLLLILAATFANAENAKKKIVLIGKDRDHPFRTHEYMADSELLAKCLRQSPGIETMVSNGWPKDQSALKGAAAVVLHTQNGGNVLFNGPHRRQAHELLKSGIGLAAIHWATGAEEGEIGELYLNSLGGWFNPKFSRYLVANTPLRRADAKHPICRGWSDFMLRDEYYILLRFRPQAKPLMVAKIEGKDHTIGWTYERPDSKYGRSFGFVCGHFHDNFADDSFRRAIVNGILWTAQAEIPRDGAPCKISGSDLELPPDTRKK